LFLCSSVFLFMQGPSVDTGFGMGACASMRSDRTRKGCPQTITQQVASRDQDLGSSLLVPTFLRQLLAPDVKTVLLFGCGGGFDFVHGMLLYPELHRCGKKVVIVSNSFGPPQVIEGADVKPVFTNPDVRTVTASAEKYDAYYAPEVHVASFLDQEYPDTAAHMLYACYARSWCQPRFTKFLQQVVDQHSVDAVVCIDGGSDSLMVGDEEGLGDPIEDAVSVASLAKLHRIQTSLLVSVGFGCDRFNHVSDAASLRAVAELTAQGGYRGCLALEPGGVPLQFYRRCLEHIYARQGFQSVLAGTILNAAEGCYGSDVVPSMLSSRLEPGSCFMWPLMGMLWAFDPQAVASRSSIIKWIDGKHVARLQSVLDSERAKLARTGCLRKVEELPQHQEYASKE